jgi:hypothetical protein
MSGEKVQANRMPRARTLTRQWEKVEFMKRKTGNLRTTMRMGAGVEVLPNGQEHNGERTSAMVRTTTDNGRDITVCATVHHTGDYIKKKTEEVLLTLVIMKVGDDDGLFKKVADNGTNMVKGVISILLVTSFCHS